MGWAAELGAELAGEMERAELGHAREFGERDVPIEVLLYILREQPPLAVR